MAAGGAVRARPGGVQRIHADHGGAHAGGELDQRAQVAEVAHAPVARRAHAVELHREAPHAAALREQLGLVAGAVLDGDLLRAAARAERLLERAARLRRDAALALPDVEVARRDFTHKAPPADPLTRGS